MKTFEEKVRDGEMIRRADGTYVAKNVSPAISNGRPAPSNVSREFGAEDAGVFFRASLLADVIATCKNRRN